MSERTLGMLMALPTLLLICGVALYPIFNAVWLSFHHLQLQFPELGRPFVGLDNYVELFRDPRFLNALGNTCLFTVLTVGFELVLGLGLALMLNREFFGRGVVRAASLIPWALTTVVAALMWQFMYNDSYGIVNAILMKTGIQGLLVRCHVVDGPVQWLGARGWAMASIVIADVWKTTPFMALLILAGLQTIPSDVYEAARIDGASTVAQFFRVTLPLLKPTILVALLFRMLDAFRVFDLIFVLTQGGPGNSTESLSYLTYLKLFRQFDFGMGSTLSVVTFLCVLAISFVFIKVLGAKTT
jgi:multiple sugar transport system permease protein